MRDERSMEIKSSNHSKKQRVLVCGLALFDRISAEELITFVTREAQKRNKRLVLNMNAFGVVEYWRNSLYRSVMKKANLIYADGIGPVWASKVRRHSLNERVNVGDYIHALLKELDQKKLSVYLLGCEPGVAEFTARIVKNEYPGLRICGFHHGFFDNDEGNRIVKEIQRERPHVVLVGMGVPYQEIWIDKNWKYLPDAVYMGVGGVFYYLTGKKRRAPLWLRNRGGEWLFRLLQEPGRLGKRYLRDNLLFCFLWVKDFLSVNVIEKKTYGKASE